MALLPINDDALPDLSTLAAMVVGLAPQAPIVVMLHGFRFSPEIEVHDPHRHILSMTPDRSCWKAVSWPRHLGLTGDRGLALGFGWHARGSIWQAHARAAQAGARLARLIEALRQVAPGRPIHIFAHSLGARLPAGAVDRIILIAAAAFRSETKRVMKSPAGRSVEVINVLGRENRLFDLLLRAALPLRGPTLGSGLHGHLNWLDLPLDQPAVLSRLAAMGHRILPARVAICHWSSYMRPGVFGLYRTLLLRPAELPIAHLRQQVTPSATAGMRGPFATLTEGMPTVVHRRTLF
jgi:hypothetical protein